MGLGFRVPLGAQLKGFPLRASVCVRDPFHGLGWRVPCRGSGLGLGFSGSLKDSCKDTTGV